MVSQTERVRDVPRPMLHAKVVLSLPLGPAILVPGLDLSLCQTESFGDKASLRNRKVLLHAEFPLQELQLTLQVIMCERQKGPRCKENA